MTIYDLAFRKACREIDDEITRWTEYAFNSTDGSDYWQMIGIAQGLEKALRIVQEHVADEQGGGRK